EITSPEQETASFFTPLEQETKEQETKEQETKKQPIIEERIFVPPPKLKGEHGQRYNYRVAYERAKFYNQPDSKKQGKKYGSMKK
ncbi:MAG: hypothetical protein ACK55I_24540, partial [bacterium]